MNDDIRFKKTNANGTPKTCKFCGAPTWWETVECRWYNPDGITLHVTTCERRQQHYHNVAMDRTEGKRQTKKER